MTASLLLVALTIVVSLALYESVGGLQENVKEAGDVKAPRKNMVVKLSYFKEANWIEINITNSHPTPLYDYQVLLTLNSSFPLWSKMSPQGIFFALDKEGETPLYFWIEDWYSNYARVWVKIPTIPAGGNATIYLWVVEGNPYPTYNSPEKVFDFYDDFETPLNTSVWTIIHYDGTGNVALHSSTVRLDSFDSGSFFWDSEDTGSGLFVSSPLLDNYAFEARHIVQGLQPVCKYEYLTMLRNNLNNDSAFFTVLYDVSCDYIGLAWRDAPGASVSRSGDGTGAQVSEALDVIVRLAKNGNVYKAYVSTDLGLTWLSAGQKTGPNYHGYLGIVDIEGNGPANGSSIVDWVRVRKYVEPEPGFAATGNVGSKSTIVLYVHNIGREKLELDKAYVTDLGTERLVAVKNLTGIEIEPGGTAVVSIALPTGIGHSPFQVKLVTREGLAYSEQVG